MFRSRTLEYAILASTEVAKAGGEPVMSAVVAETLNLPKAFPSMVMRDLAKARVLRSKRGPTGGFQLARPANQITLLEIYEAVMGPVRGGDWAELPTSMRRTVNDATEAVAELICKRLGAVRLAELMKR